MTKSKSQKKNKEEVTKTNNEEAVTPEVEGKESENENSKVEEKEDKSAVKDKSQASKKDEENEAEKLKKELSDLNDKHLRLIAEYDNYRKRTLKEKMDLSRMAGEKILVEILPVVDDFERALQHIDNAEDIKAVKEGVELIYSKLIGYLSRQGVKQIETNEVDFDADVHEAVTKIPAPKDELKGKVVDCVQKGYQLQDKVIRFPKVVIGE